MSGYRIIDLSENMAGPFGTMVLADQGADVIKVESLRGDALRHAGSGSRAMGAYFANLNRSKRSVAVDLQRPEGRKVLDRLLEGADVVVQSFRPAAATRLGIDAATLRHNRPELIYVSIVGFGETGPLAGRPVYDHVIQAMAGMASLQADAPNGEPRLVRHGLVDKATGHVLAQSVCAALLARARTGVGEALTITMLDVALHFFWPDAMMAKTALDPEVRLPPASETFRLTPTADGHIAIVVLTDEQWNALATSVSIDATGMRRGDLLRAVKAHLAGMSTANALALLEAHDVACGPVVTQDEVHELPQVLANEALRLYDHPAIGMLRQPAPVPRFDSVDPAALRPAPLLGEHTLEVLTQVGMDPVEVRALQDAGVVHSPVTAVDVP
jgi:crotonobetainyl-CoA:carnitine CoA-transferase CaiB-like acyl-CoA transferase